MVRMAFQMKKYLKRPSQGKEIHIQVFLFPPPIINGWALKKQCHREPKRCLNLPTQPTLILRPLKVLINTRSMGHNGSDLHDKLRCKALVDVIHQGLTF